MDIRINSVQINFKISKINGKDVQSKSPADILDFFKLSRNQTLLVEMIPKALIRDESKNSIKSVDSHDSIDLRKENIANISTQTEWTLAQDNWPTNAPDRPKSDVNLKCPLSSSRSDHSVNSFQSSSHEAQCNGNNNNSGGHISSMMMNHHQHFHLPSYLYQQSNGLAPVNDDARLHDYEIIEEDSEDEEDIDDDEDDILECDAIEYEEVTLVRRSSENLGFTLSSSYDQLAKRDNPTVQSKASHPDRVDENCPPETNNKLPPTSSSSSPSLSHTSDHHHHQYQHLNRNQNPNVQLKSDEKKSEMIGEVYINSLNANSPAALDGRIKIGDQILEINDMEIKNIGEAQAIFDRKDINTFELLIGRPNPAHDHDKCRQISLYRRLSLYESLETEPNLHTDSDYLSQLQQQHHVSIVDCSQEFYMLSLKNANSVPNSSNSHHQVNCIQESISYPCENGGATSKDERDSGMGKTDGDSSEGKANDDTYSIDHHHCHQLSSNGENHREAKACSNNFKPETGPSSIKQSSGEEDILEQKRKLLQEEMTNIQLQCESLSQQFQDELNKSEVNKINGKHCLTQQQHLSQHGEEEAIYDEPIFVRNDSKVTTFSSKNKPKIPQKPSFSSSSSSSSKDYLPEIQQQDKKESIKRWIRSGLPTTPPSAAANVATSQAQSLSPQANNDWKEQVTCTDHLPNQVGVGKDFITIQIPQPSIISIPNNNNNGFRGNNSGLVTSFISPPKKATIMTEDKSSSSNNKRKDVAVATEERLTQIESDCVSLTSCESCRLCSNPHVLDHRRPDCRVNPVNPEDRHSQLSVSQVAPCEMPVNHIVEPDINYRGKLSIVKSEINHHQSSSFQCANTVAISPSASIVGAGPMSSYPTTTTMYTTEANLEHTIQIQQQLFRQALLAQQKAKPWKQRTDQMSMEIKSNHPSASDHLITSSSSTSSPSSQHNNNNMMMNADSQLRNGPPMSSVRREILTHQLKYQPLQSPGHCSNDSVSGWKIKRRPDGTQYITRKVSRSKILRDRGEKINQERSGMTTDDDAMSELKIGRYWTRDERKKHLEKARDRKRKELLHRANKKSALREQSEERDHSQKLIKGLSGQDSGSINNQHSSGSSGSMARSRSKHNGCTKDAHGQVSSNDKAAHQAMMPNGQTTCKSRSSGVLSVTTV
ncbi:uncharacterized protein LOC141853396 [Brevipalpus obovatus]|uniref:uncharacterized protein LOC141853396 n=1 Tax=Brevipalpus obovatus TaxID=246614 RepID=UPI003D9EF63E